MAYTDIVQLYTWFGTNAQGPFEVEQTAAIGYLQGRTSDAGTAPAAAKDSVFFPCGGELLAFGFTIDEAITNTNATLARFIVQYVSTSGASAVAAATLDIPNANQFTVGNTTTSYDGTTGIVGPNVRPQGTTTTIAKALGSRIVHPGFVTTTGPNSKVLPYHLIPGSRIYVEQTVAGGAAGGSVTAFCIVRHNSSIFPTEKGLSATGAQSAVSLAPLCS